jgi:hypothetical protein
MTENDYFRPHSTYISGGHSTLRPQDSAMGEPMKRARKLTVTNNIGAEDERVRHHLKAVANMIPNGTAAEHELTVSLLTQLNISFGLARANGWLGFSGDTDLTALRMVASIPQMDPFNDRLGPFYTTASLTKWLGVSRQYVHEITKQRRLLVLTTADGFNVYPSFQFNLRGSALPHLPALISALETHLEPWTQAMWLITKSDELDGLTPASWLMGGGSVDAAVSAAEGYKDLLNGGPMP